MCPWRAYTAVRFHAEVGSMALHHGGCHCRTVRFEVEAPASRFRLVAGADSLTSYGFGTGVAKHLFCRRCGIKSFYVPRSNPDGYSVNLRCLDAGTIEHVEVEPFDGQNWERGAAALAHRSHDDG